MNSINVKHSHYGVIKTIFPPHKDLSNQNMLKMKNSKKRLLEVKINYLGTTPGVHTVKKCTINILETFQNSSISSLHRDFPINKTNQYALLRLKVLVSLKSLWLAQHESFFPVWNNSLITSDGEPEIQVRLFLITSGNGRSL